MFSLLTECRSCRTRNRVPVQYLARKGRCGSCKGPLGPMDVPIEADEANFGPIIRDAKVPVLVDFWAEWCGPCRMIAPTIDALATEYAGKVKVGKLNVDENQQTTINFQVRGIPAVMLFKGGRVVDQIVGVADKADFKRMIDKHLEIGRAHV